MKKYLIFSIIVISLMVPPLSQAEEFTQKDRERLIRLETKVEEGQKALQRQITDLSATTQRQTDDLKGLILWGFGILFGGMGFLSVLSSGIEEPPLNLWPKSTKGLKSKERSIVKGGKYDGHSNF